MELNLNNSMCKAVVMGTVYESNLTKTNTEIELYKDGEKTGKTKSCEQIKGFIDVEYGGDRPRRFYITAKSVNPYPNDAGRYEEPRNWKMFEKALELKSVINDGEGASKVCVECNIEENAYVSEQGKFIDRIMQMRPVKISTKAYKEDCAYVGGTYRILRMTPEVKNDTETGRMNAVLAFAHRKNRVSLIDCIIPEDIAEAMEDADIGVNAVIQNVEMRLVKVHVGGAVRSSGKGIGKKNETVNVNAGGFDTTELQLVYLEEFEEPELEEGIEYRGTYLFEEPLKACMVERKKMHKEIEDNGYQGSNKKKEKKKAETTKPKKSIGTASKKIELDDDAEDEPDFEVNEDDDELSDF